MGNYPCCQKDENQLTNNMYNSHGVRQERMSEMSFRIHAMTGDLLLFKSKPLMSKVQRKVTKTEFDHVAIIVRVRGDPSEIYFLEAVQSGVRLCRWSEIRPLIFDQLNKTNRNDYFYEKVVFRHVRKPRNTWFNDTMYDFLSESLGKQYEFSGEKFFR